MKRNLNQLANKEYDLIIIGAGAFGSCAAWEAASRGLFVAIIDRGDFCCATSANHLKMVHGGIRYLQHGDIKRVRESCRERSILLRIAPHLVKPIPIVMPTFGHGMEGRTILKIGLLLYDLITLDRNRQISDPNRRIPFGNDISRSECLKLFPMLSNSSVTGAGIFYDGQFYNPPRLALSFLKSAERLGAHLGNYVEVISLFKQRDRVCGVKVKDRVSGNEFCLRGRLVLNTAGPWADGLLEKTVGIRLNPKPRFSRDLGFVVSRRISDEYALACRIDIRDPDALLSRKGRHIFLVPWRNYTLIGVWHLVYSHDPDDIVVKEEELQGYIEDVNRAYRGLDLTVDEITVVNTGLTLFGDNQNNSKDLRFGKRSLLIDHSKAHSIDGLITLIGVRATTARGMAERVIDIAFRKLGKKPVKSETHISPVFGGDIDDFSTLIQKVINKNEAGLSQDEILSLLQNYGSEYTEVLKYTYDRPSLADAIGDSFTIKAQVIHAVREEMAVKLGDVVFRRTDLGTGNNPSDEEVGICAELMANELSWDKNKIRDEIYEVKNSGFLLRPV